LASIFWLLAYVVRLARGSKALLSPAATIQKLGI
jgi:hypothetical protein